MRRLFPCFSVRHNITVVTGDRPNAGTHANVFLVLYDDKGHKSSMLRFDRILRFDLERGTTQTFKGPKVDDEFGDLSEIELWRDDSGPFDGWYCDLIEVEDTKTGVRDAFPVQRWVKPDFHYFIPVRHTTLPQDDKYPEQRAKDLAHKRELYQYTQKLYGLPMQIKDLPEDENFSLKYTFDLAAVAVPAFGKSRVIQSLDSLKSKLSGFETHTRWETTDDIQGLYKFDIFPKPRAVEFYKDDVWFAARKLAGTNPTEIKLCTAIPEKFDVTREMVEEFLEGKTLSEVIEEKKLFIIDYHLVEGIPTKSPDLEFPAPMALFFLDGYKTLRPIAIQLQQKPGPENPVFLPSDPSNLWMLAKMWFNLADSMVHQSLSHLGFTHLVMEGICINMHRNLAMNHPVFRLLAPHFLYLLAINAIGVERLFAPDGFVAKTMQCGVKGMLELIARKFKCYRFDIDGVLPEQIRHRGMDSQEVIPVYPYRDDGVPVYYAIRDYVMRILNHYYDTPQKLADDAEIQAWGREMAAPEPEGLEIQGLPNNGNFTEIEDLGTVVTGIIFTCSAEHAAVNFQQYEEYAFPPNYPATLNGKIPTNKDVPSDQDLVNIVADRKITLDTMIVTKLLSERATLHLGDWELAYQYDEFALETEKQFREELKNLSKQNEERNKTRSDLLKYDVLDPRNIPNAISI